MGPGADKGGAYPNTEYYTYNKMSYFDLEEEMSAHRIPQPGANNGHFWGNNNPSLGSIHILIQFVIKYVTQGQPNKKIVLKLHAYKYPRCTVYFDKWDHFFSFYFILFIHFIYYINFLCEM